MVNHCCVSSGFLWKSDKERFLCGREEGNIENHTMRTRNTSDVLLFVASMESGDSNSLEEYNRFRFGDDSEAAGRSVADAGVVNRYRRSSSSAAAPPPANPLQFVKVRNPASAANSLRQGGWGEE